jgi:hypothetical protein
MNGEPSNIVEIKDWRERNRRDREFDLPPEMPLSGGDGGGTFDGMEARVARLEADVEHIKSDVGEIKGTLKDVSAHVSDARVSIATLVERVAHLPSKAYIGSVVTAGIAALGLLARLGWLVPGATTH